MTPGDSNKDFLTPPDDTAPSTLNSRSWKCYCNFDGERVVGVPHSWISVGHSYEHLKALEIDECLVLPGYNGKSIYATLWWLLPGVWVTVDASRGRRLGCLSFAITRIWGIQQREISAT